ncbi:MAG: hypothetical protein IPF50_00515 [Proteobacteria bacterium]|nr:hypothetical protein [Pseudomonadota bacterium]
MRSSNWRRSPTGIRWPGRSKLALIPTVGPYLLPQYRRPAATRAAAAQTHAVRIPDRTTAERLRAGEIDVGARAARGDGRPRGCATSAEPFVLAVPASHALSLNARRVKVEDLRGETLLLLEDGHCLRDQALEVSGRVRVSEEQDYRATRVPADFAPRWSGRPRHHAAARSSRPKRPWARRAACA